MIAALAMLALFIRRSPRQAFASIALCGAGVAVATMTAGTLMTAQEGFNRREDKVMWREPSAVPTGDATALVRRSTEIFKGQKIDVVEITAAGPSVANRDLLPVPPGLNRVPDAGQVALSPSLAELIAKTPDDQLGERFGITGGSATATIGEAGLSRPNELVAVIGRSPEQLPLEEQVGESEQVGTSDVGGFRLPGEVSAVTPISAFDSHKRDILLQTYSELGLVAMALVVAPAAMLVGSSAQLTAKRRAQRLAVLRLAGATPWAVRALAAGETALGASLGAVIGVIGAKLVSPLLRQVPMADGTWFSGDLSMPLAKAVGLAVAATATSVLVSVVALRRVAESPLSVARSSNPRTARWPRVLVLISSIIVMVLAAASASTGGSIVALTAGLVTVIASLALIGPWITSVIGRVLGAVARRPSTLIGARRICDDPAASYRVVSAVVLAGLVAGFISAVVPTAAALSQENGSGVSLRISLPAPAVSEMRALAESMGASVTADDGGPNSTESTPVAMAIEPGPHTSIERLRTASSGIRQGIPLVASTDDLWGNATLASDIGKGSMVVLVSSLILAAAASTVLAAASVLDERRTLARLVLAGVAVDTLHRSRRWQMMLPLICATVGSVSLGLGSGVVLMMGFGMKADSLASPSLVDLVGIMAMSVAIGAFSAAITRPILVSVTRTPSPTAW
ncbi:MAG: FtsX-like permease family protein [Microthrixaceae bacterium]